MSSDSKTDESAEQVGADPPASQVGADPPASDDFRQEVESPAKDAKADNIPDATPHMASIQTLWSRSVRSLVVVLLVGAAVAYALFGTVLARNVTFNMSQSIDPGRSNGIRRFSRETIMGVWRTMWDKAPDFGTVDLTRGILLVSTVAFFAAFALVIMLIFVPSRREWAASLGDDQASDTISGD